MQLLQICSQLSFVTGNVASVNMNGIKHNTVQQNKQKGLKVVRIQERKVSGIMWRILRVTKKSKRQKPRDDTKEI
jgi:hypothetical protein